MNAQLPFAQVARYGDVRGTKVEQVLPILSTLFERAIIGLPGACVALDDAAVCHSTPGSLSMGSPETRVSDH